MSADRGHRRQQAAADRSVPVAAPLGDLDGLFPARRLRHRRPVRLAAAAGPVVVPYQPQGSDHDDEHQDGHEKEAHAVDVPRGVAGATTAVFAGSRQTILPVSVRPSTS